MVRFDTGRNDEELAQLLATMTGAGIGVAQFREVALDLEDAFLSVTGQDESPVVSLAAGGSQGGESAVAKP